MKKRPSNEITNHRHHASVLPRNYAERSVFSCIADRFEVSAPELIRYTGMPGSTVAGILSRLVRRGVVSPCGTETRQRGRPSIRYRICIPRPVYACQVEATQVSAAAFDRNLTVQGLETNSFIRIGSLKEGSEAITAIINRLKAPLRKSTSPPAELALALNAIRLRPDRQRLISSVLPWVELDLAETLAKKLGMHVKIVPPLGPLIAEKQRLHGRHSQTIVRFQVGDGVSAHMAFGGEAYQGYSSLAGQLGHVTVEANGPLCGCGRRGCLEAYCGGPALHKRLLEEVASGVGTTIDHGQLTMASVRKTIDLLWEAWKLGDSYAREFMRPVLDRLAWSLGVVVNLIDPELVLACGYVLGNRPEWIEEICWRAQQWTVYSPARPIRMIPSQASLEDELRVTGTLYFYGISNYNR